MSGISQQISVKCQPKVRQEIKRNILKQNETRRLFVINVAVLLDAVVTVVVVVVVILVVVNVL